MLLHASIDDAGVRRRARENAAAAESAGDDFAGYSLIVESNGPSRSGYDVEWVGSARQVVCAAEGHRDEGTS